MSAVAWYLEEAGIATTGISLVRENTAALRPPRFLWVSFPLGRPLGLPGDAPFQRRVVLAALALLDAPEGPVLEDYPEDVPAIPADAAVACPVRFPARVEGDGTWTAALRGEVALLRPWYGRSVERRGRTTVGVADAPIEELTTRFGRWLDAPEELPRTLPALRELKRALSDLRAFHEEAVTAQPGEMPWREVRRVLWRESVLGQAILTLRDRFRRRATRGCSRSRGCWCPAAHWTIRMPGPAAAAGANRTGRVAPGFRACRRRVMALGRPFAYADLRRTGTADQETSC